MFRSGEPSSILHHQILLKETTDYITDFFIFDYLSAKPGNTHTEHTVSAKFSLPMW